MEMRLHWLLVCSTLFLVNAGLVLTTTVQHFASAADETLPQAGADKTVEPVEFSGDRLQKLAADQTRRLDATVTGPSAEEPSESAERRPPSPERLESLSGGRLSEAPPIGDDSIITDLPLPEVPSLGDEIPPDDPEFLEFQKLADEIYPRHELAESDTAASSEAYFANLDKRLTTVQQLIAAAQATAVEAAAKNREGHTRQAQQLLRLAAQMREIAAELLVLEL